MTDVDAIDADHPSGGILHSTDDVEESCFAGTIGANQPCDLSRLNIKVNTTHGHHSTKANHNLANFKKSH
jgi:hypothetical protein